MRTHWIHFTTEAPLGMGNTKYLRRLAYVGPTSDATPVATTAGDPGSTTTPMATTTVSESTTEAPMTTTGDETTTSAGSGETTTVAGGVTTTADGMTTEGGIDEQLGRSPICPPPHSRSESSATDASKSLPGVRILAGFPKPTGSPFH